MLKGSCQCGAVKVEVEAPEPRGYSCYCAICRTIAGSACATVLAAKRGAFRVASGEAALSSYCATPTYRRYHCATCHAPIYGEVLGKPELPLYVSALLFDAAAVAHIPFEHMFVRSRVAWHSIGDDRPQHETYPGGVG